jgi:hypothetical protein
MPDPPKCMSEFRDQLHVARLGYHAPLYPNDLASQLFPPKRSIWPRIIGTLVAGAAAVLMVTVLLEQAIVQPQPQRSEQVASKPPPEDVNLPALPRMPQTVLPAPVTGDQPLFLPSLPSFPSIGDVLEAPNQSNESPKEAGKSRESL